MTELDLGVWRVGRADGPDWVARWFPARRPAEAVAGDAAILRYLAAREFPAERCAADEPVSVLDGRSLLVTEWADPVPRQQRRDAIRAAGGLSHLGALLGRLHTLDTTPAASAGGIGVGDGAVARPGGAWHHLADGLPSAEIAAASRMLAEAAPLIPDAERAAFDALRAEVAALDAAEALPEGLIHPDFVLANVVATPGGMVLVHWAGAGRGPRLWPLAFLLYAEAAKEPRRAGAVLLGYREHVTPEAEELDRLGAGPDPPPHPPRLVCVHGTDNADGGHDSRVADEGPDRDDRHPGPRGDRPLISRWSPCVTLDTACGRHHRDRRAKARRRLVPSPLTEFLSEENHGPFGEKNSSSRTGTGPTVRAGRCGPVLAASIWVRTWAAWSSSLT